MAMATPAFTHLRVSFSPNLTQKFQGNEKNAELVNPRNSVPVLCIRTFEGEPEHLFSEAVELSGPGTRAITYARRLDFRSSTTPVQESAISASAGLLLPL